MGGERIERYWAAEMRSAIERYRQFEMLIPASSGSGAGHHGEDGRYVESILKSTLKQFLPQGLDILSGFILRAGVKSPESGKQRGKDGEEHLGIQFLLKGILDVYYGEGRGCRKEPGMFSFPSRRQFDGIQKSISYKKIKAGRFG